MRPADLVADFPQVFDIVWVFHELLSRVRMHIIDDKMCVDMLPIGMRGDENLVPVPRAVGELFGDLRRFRRGDVLARVEGLHVMAEEKTVCFAEGFLRQHELFVGDLRRTVLT